MKRTLLSISGIVLLGLILIVLNGVSSKILGGGYWDLTAEKLYSLSSGTKNILKKIEADDDIVLRFYFSKTDSSSEPAIQFYGKNVIDILKEFQRAGNGKLKLEIYDPRPDSIEEEAALKYGLDPMPLANGQQIFMGIVATNSWAKENVIPVLDFTRQQFLELDIANLIFSITRKEKPVIGIMSSISLTSPAVPGQLAPQLWVGIDQLQQYGEIKQLSGKEENIPDDIKLLLVIHPKNFSQQQLYNIDQFVMKGGSLFVLEDPFCESDTPPDNKNPMMMATASRNSDLNAVLAKWGVELESGYAVGDLNLGTAVNLPHSGTAINFVLWPTFGAENIDRNDVTTSALENILMPWAGSLKLTNQEGVSYVPLVKSTSQGVLIPETQYRFQGGNPESLRANFDVKNAVERIVAVRIRGKLKSAFPEGRPKKEKLQADDEINSDSMIENQEQQTPVDSAHVYVSNGNSNVVVVSDVDFISDRFAVVAYNVLGKSVASYRNDNLPFFFNVIENLLGSDDLIGIRSRGQFSRPFTKVLGMQQEAQESLRIKEQELNSSLMQANERLRALQEQGGGVQNQRLLDRAVVEEINNIKSERQSIVKQIREVKRQYRENIEGMGEVLFVLNTFLVPIILIIGAICFHYFKRGKAGGDRE